ncbi:MAG: hypothetical protein IIV79_00865, partial [Clostridia bacterium]|nr:hypothetical protein [Clostridia bacterium]
LPGKKTRSYDFEAAYRVNNLVYYLCNLDGVSAADGEIIISDIDITRANLIAESEDTYEVGMYVHLNTGAGAKDNMIITVTSYGNDNSITDQVALPVDEATTYEFGISAVCGDRITVSVEGTQYLEKGAYFYEPEGGRDHSQCLVGVGGGKTRVKANESFVFNSDIEMGIRIYKTAADTGLPLSDITFDIYNVILNEGETVGKIPTEEDIAKYATDEYKVGSITTDVTGYASLALDRGMYLVVEKHNEHKIKAPMAPFFISVPMPSESKDPSDDANTDVAIKPQDIVSIYPKNEPVEPPEDPPEIPYPPDNVKGRFSISKHDAYDEFKKLSGASFQVFRMATAEDTDVQIVRCDGIEYAVVPLTVDGENLILTTDENGSAVSPQLTCGTYFLVETATPKGYIPLDEAVLVTVKSQLISDAEVLNIANYPGEILPGTGGAGIAWMIWIGSAIAIITAILLITEKKMKNYNSAE